MTVANGKSAKARIRHRAGKQTRLDSELQRIEEITKNARATWFTLIGALVFAAVTLASVEDASFFVSNSHTKLPLAGISVPIQSFFWAGSLLVAALYIYLHLYLEQLWHALGQAPARVDGAPLADRIYPWLVSDTALRTRDRMRFGRDTTSSGNRDHVRSSRNRSLGWMSDLVSFGLVWFFGLSVVTWFWWRSMPAHDIWLTGWLAAVLIVTALVFLSSLSNALRRLGKREKTKVWVPAFTVAAILIVGLTIVRTHTDMWAGDPRIDRSQLGQGCTEFQKEKRNRTFCPYWLNYAMELLRPARAEMAEFVFTQRPPGWLGKENERTKFRVAWCKQNPKLTCPYALSEKHHKFDTPEEAAKFEAGWTKHWNALLASFEKQDLRDVDLRGANLINAKLEGADLSGASLEGANLYSARLDGANLFLAWLEGADLSRARLDGANLSSAMLDGANLSGARLDGANLFEARLEGADLLGARLEGAKLNLANLEGAKLSFAKLEGAKLNLANLEGADLRGARLEGAKLNLANLEGANLLLANLEGADLRGASLMGTRKERMTLKFSNFTNAKFANAYLRFIDLTGAELAIEADLNTTFGDGSVKLPTGVNRPAHWCKSQLSDEVYFGRLRGWSGSRWFLSSLREELGRYPVIAPETPCP